MNAKIGIMRIWIHNLNDANGIDQKSRVIISESGVNLSTLNIGIGLDRVVKIRQAVFLSFYKVTENSMSKKGKN
jgi:hypothetical protein